MHIRNNRGEVMDDLGVTAVMNTVSNSSPTMQSLPAGEQFRARIPLGSPPAVPGAYPILLRINYRSDTGQPISAIRPAVLDTAEPLLDAEIEIETFAAPLKRRSQLAVTLKNLTDEPRAGFTTVHVGNKIRCAPNRQPFRLAPGSTTELRFPILNIHSQPGRQQRALVFVEYRAAEVQRCAIHEARLLVAGSARMLFHHTRLWQSLVVLLAISFVALQFFPRR